jgi:tetratricopeptide (TPR) repeat protein
MEEALELSREGFALLEPGFKPDIPAGLYANLGRCQLLRSEYQPALESFQNALALWLDVSGVMSVDTCQTLGHILGNLGRMSEALGAYARAAELARRNGQEFRHRQQPSGVGWILRELGAFQAAVAADQRAIESARAAGARYCELSQLIDLGADQLAAGAPELASLALERARQLLGESSLRALPYDLHGAKLRLLAAESLAHRARAEPERARRAAEELLLMAGLYDSAKYKATAQRLFAGVSRVENDLSAAEQQLGAALESLSERPVPILAWRIQAELAGLQLGRGALDLAHSSFGAARQIVLQIAGSIEQVDLRQSFLDSAEVRNVLVCSGA